jgi:mannose-1-phosphate guanylyltransferase
MPKQFYPLFDQRSLFQAVIDSNSACSDSYAIAANKDQAFLAFEQLARKGLIDKKGVIEPIGRNTAPAIALVAMMIDPSELLLINPSDHLISKPGAYHSAIKRAAELADEGKLVTFGIAPTYPEIGYGYIEHDNETVLRFREKPDEKTAEQYVASGRYLWNAGIFCFKAGTFLSELAAHCPDVYNACLKIVQDAKARGVNQLLTPTLEEMETIPSISVDYAVLEHSDKVAVIPCDIGWSDLGSFESLYPVAFDPKLQNSVLTEDPPLCIDSKDNLIISRGSKKVVLIDMHDTSVIDTEDALLVMKRGSGQKVKQAVDTLKNTCPDLVKTHTTVARPWGYYTVLFDSECTRVQRIVVQPGQRISLQKHQFRQEHWVCTEGVGVAILDGRRIALECMCEMQVPAHGIHRIECTGTIPLVIIETQIGTNLGDSDVLRLEDDYNRVDG